MIKKISRDEAIIFASFVEMFELSQEESDKLSIDVLAEEGMDSLPDILLHKLMREYLIVDLEITSNQYLKKVLSDKLNLQVEIIGDGKTRIACPCCGYKTVINDYDICKVCFWKYDGNNDENKYSSVNHMTLRDAMNNYNKFGVVKEDYKNILDPERKSRYDR